MRKESYMVQNLTRLVDCSSFSLVNSKLLPNGIVVCNNNNKKIERKIPLGLKITQTTFHSVKLISSICKQKGHRHREMLLHYFVFIPWFLAIDSLVWYW